MSNEMLIRCCAPTMAGLKTGNMFNCPFDSKEEMTAELRRLNRILGSKGLRILPLRWSNGRALVYLFRPKRLEQDLQNELAAQILLLSTMLCVGTIFVGIFILKSLALI